MVALLAVNNGGCNFLGLNGDSRALFITMIICLIGWVSQLSLVCVLLFSLCMYDHNNLYSNMITSTRYGCTIATYYFISLAK